MKKNSGITVLPIVIGILVSVVFIVLLVTKAIEKNNADAQEQRRIATEMSDYGFQEITMQLMAIEELAEDAVISVDSTEIENGWYKLNVHKVINYDTMVITIESIGGSGIEVVSQERQFKLVKQEDSTGVHWFPTR